MAETWRIGTRGSPLALWQARFVQAGLAEHGIESRLVPIKSDGERDLVSPLYEMGVQGIFTRSLDMALLAGKIDLAVHSLKDVPTQLPQGLVLAAVPKRGQPGDTLVYKNRLPSEGLPYTVATSSLRRSAQWIYKYKSHQTAVLRGNLHNRLQKLIEHDDWDGALFAAAGIERIMLDVPNLIHLDWMIPAPGQGALAVVAKEKDFKILEFCEQLNHKASALATAVERSFLRLLMGGCSMPIGAHASIEGDFIHFVGCVLSLDGARMAKVELTSSLATADGLAAQAVEQLLATGGREIVDSFKK